MVLLIIMAVLLVPAIFSSSWRRDLMKPEHSAWKIFIYLGVYTAFDLAVGLPLKGFTTLGYVGVITLSCAILIPLILLGEHYTSKWWRVSER